MIRKTRFSISTDETRHALTGIYVIVKEKTIEMVATDGHRLSYIREELSQPQKQDTVAILPIKPLNEIVRTFPEEGEKVKILIDKNYVSFNAGDATLISRLIEGTFPNYEQVIPKKTEKQIIVNTQELLTCLRRVSIVSDERSSLIRLKTEAGFLIVSGSTPSSGEGSDKIAAVSTGGDLEIGFNARYLMDVLRAIDSEKTEINMTTPSSPVLIKPIAEETRENYLNVIMPLRL
jgi:DNA polymerase-3 subunit beta